LVSISYERTSGDGPCHSGSDSWCDGKRVGVRHERWCFARHGMYCQRGSRLPCGSQRRLLVKMTSDSVVAIKFCCHERTIVRSVFLRIGFFASSVIDCHHEMTQPASKTTSKTARVAADLARLVLGSQEATVLQCAQAAGGTAELGDSRLNGIGASRSASKVPEGLARKLAPLARTLHAIRIRRARGLACAPVVQAMPKEIQAAICTLRQADPNVEVAVIVEHVAKHHAYKTSTTVVKRVLQTHGLARRLWSGVWCSCLAMNEELCGFAYMPSTLDLFSRELKYVGVSNTLWEVHARIWLDQQRIGATRAMRSYSMSTQRISPYGPTYSASPRR